MINGHLAFWLVVARPILIACWICCFYAQPLLADLPYNFTYSGRLMATGGVPVAGPVDINVNFYQADGATPKGTTYSFPNTTLVDGVFQITLPLQGAAYNSIFDAGETKIEVTYQGSDKISHKAPQQTLTAVPYALRIPVDGATVSYNSIGQLSAVAGSNLVASGVTPGSYTRADIAVDSYGRITSASSSASTTADLAGIAVTGILPVSRGGTGGMSYNNGSVILGGTTLSSVAPGASYQVFGMGTSGGTPSYGAVDLGQSAAVTGLLPIVSGGTGASSSAGARTAMGLGGLATMSTIGSSEIADGSIVDADISPTAAISYTKIAGLGSAGARTAMGLGGLATMSTVGSSEIADGSIVDADISPTAAISYTKIAGLGSTGARTAMGLGGLATMSTIGSSEITDGSIVDADISPTAAISYTKIAGLGSTIALWNQSSGNAYRSSGYVGIGTNAPTSPLEVNGVIHSTVGGIKFPDGSMQSSAAAGSWSSSGDDYTTGSLGVGISSPSARLHLYSSNSGGTGDFTDVSDAPLKIQASSGYWRIPHLSATAGISGVYNYQTGKDVYWGEDPDTGHYYFRGRHLIATTGNIGIGTIAPAQRLSVTGTIESTSGGFKFPDGTLQSSAAGVGSTNLVIKTANYSLTTADNVVLANASSSSITLTLPSAVGIAGRSYTLKKIDSSTNGVLIATTASQTIDGASLYGLGRQYEAASLVSDGANWNLISVINLGVGSATGDSSFATLDYSYYRSLTLAKTDVVGATSGSFTVSDGPLSVDILMVGGGGGGGDGNANGGGGGGGGVLLGTLLLPSGTYSVSVGAGGAGVSAQDYSGTSGGNTTLVVSGTTFTAYGGGAGGSFNVAAATGGSGGGGSGPSNNPSGAASDQGSTTSSYGTLSGYGNSGGSTGGVNTFGGGGGGAGGAGGLGSGGAGIANVYQNGTTKYYAGGGGGACFSVCSSGGVGGSGVGGTGAVISSTPAGSGLNGTGGGGGGFADSYISSSYGHGGNGVFILRYHR